VASACARCRLFSDAGVDGQGFYHDDLCFDVSKARAIILAAPRKPIEVPPLNAFKALYDAGISIKHTKHVDIRYPAIVIRWKRQWVFIDGNHRAYSRLFRKLPVKAYLLTPREVRAVLDTK
jgi:hypothetical protein